MFDIYRPITTLSGVKSFAQYLYGEIKLAFHPDESFEDYIDIDSHNYVFSKSEAKCLNKRMEECFKVCEKEKVDIYNYMMQYSPIHSFMRN